MALEFSSTSCASRASSHQHQARRHLAGSTRPSRLQRASRLRVAASASHTCRRCLSRFTADGNRRDSCRHHPALYSGGEVAKAIGFVRASAEPGDQLEAVVGRKGLLRFWDCCGDEEESSPGCQSSYHVTYDAEINEANGWSS